MVTRTRNEGEFESQVADFKSGEGRCPVVPLVFKTGKPDSKK